MTDPSVKRHDRSADVSVHRRWGRVHGWMDSVTSGGTVYPLIVLFGLNAVDELDRTAFGVLLPEIREDFGLDLQGVLTLVGLVYLCALLLQVPIAALADRTNRVRLSWIGAIAWGICSLLTGMAATLWMLGATRAGSAIGRAVVDPTHGSLLADYYPPEARAKVFSFHRAANAVGQFLGPVSAGFIAAATSWRWPFVFYSIPTAIFVVMAWRMKEPVRGGHERRAVGADEATIAMEEVAPTFAEGWRIVWRIETLKRIWWSLPFLAASLIGFASLASLVYDEVFGLDERARGLASAAAEPWALAGLIYGARVATRLYAEGPEHILGFLSKVTIVVERGPRGVRGRAQRLGRDRRPLGHHGGVRGHRARRAGHPQPVHPAACPFDGVRRRVALGDPGSRDAADHRLGGRPAQPALGHAADGPDLPHRRPRHLDVAADDRP